MNSGLSPLKRLVGKAVWVHLELSNVIITKKKVASSWTIFLNILMLNTPMIDIVLPGLDLHNYKKLVNTSFTYIPGYCECVSPLFDSFF